MFLSALPTVLAAPPCCPWVWGRLDVDVLGTAAEEEEEGGERFGGIVVVDGLWWWFVEGGWGEGEGW